MSELVEEPVDRKCWSQEENRLMLRLGTALCHGDGDAFCDLYDRALCKGMEHDRLESLIDAVRERIDEGIQGQSREEE